jgi:16S rRNA G966 N2-methylase RsmD
LVEKDRKKELVIRQNMVIAQDVDVKIVMTSVEAFLKTAHGSFDFIHLDPPFPYTDKVQLLHFVAQSSVWHHDTIITIHYPKRDKLPMQFGNWYCYDTRSYGESQLNFYQFLSHIEES